MSPSPIEEAAVELHAANEALTRHLLAARWLSLEAAAAQVGVSKGSISDAVRTGKLRALRTLPGPGRGSVLTWVDPVAVAAYVPRPYPGRACLGATT